MKDTSIFIRVSREEKKIFIRLAKKASLSLSAYLRSLAVKKAKEAGLEIEGNDSAEEICQQSP